jgi:nitrite reductase/ring-hydroxylating ferredoxin subunit
MASVEQVGKVGELAPGDTRRVEVGGKGVLLVNVNGRLLTVAAECTHAGGPLEEGFLEGNTVECPWHGGQFDLDTGQPVSGPPMIALARYKVWVRGEDVLVDVGQAPD